MTNAFMAGVPNHPSFVAARKNITTSIINGNPALQTGPRYWGQHVLRDRTKELPTIEMYPQHFTGKWWKPN
jgi:hypothetical protein